MSTSPTLDLTPEEEPEAYVHQLETVRTPERHDWRQLGNWIVCKSCVHEHAFEIGVHKHLAGVDADGKPRLIDRLH